MNDQERLEMTAANCEVLRSRLEKYEDADGNPISTISEQAREIASLRSIISECASACGAVVSVQCSEGFMAMLPDEIRSVISGKSREIERLQATVDGLDRQNDYLADEISALKAQPSGVVEELIKRAADVVEGLHGEDLPGAIPVRIQKLKAALESLNSSPVSAPTYRAYTTTPGEAVAGTLHISHFRDNPAMENVDFQLIADLKPGSYKLYTHPADQVAEGVVVARELLERAAKHLSEGRLDGPAAHELRALLANSEGVKKP